MPRQASAKGLDESAARELIGHALTAFSNDKAAKKVKPDIDAVFELARLNAGGGRKRGLSITGISIGPTLELSSDEGSVTVVANQTGPIVDAKQPRKLVAWGNSHKTCRLVDIPLVGERWVCVIH